MDAQNKTFQTGMEYCLKDLFSSDNKIIIPDLQRDYCWGDKAELVGNFVNNLIELFNKTDRQQITMGLIYGYEEPFQYLQLCDGQQRLTTLFLLLGLINKRTGNAFERYIITDKTLKEPRLQYAIRENTLYFLFDLVGNFFIGNNSSLNIDDIRNRSWYFKDYDVDPSIQSMIKALTAINKRLTNHDIKDKCEEFGDFLMNKVFFLYYDMENRRNGEETFVIINTTGEPLTATENLKPLMLSKIADEEKQKSASQKWERWEDFFWQNRDKNDTADIGLKEFFRWVVLLQFDVINGKKADFRNTAEFIDGAEFKRLDPETVDAYFNIITFIYKKNIIENFSSYLAPKEQNDQIALFKILPVIEYIYRFGQSDLGSIRRIARFFFNLSRVDNVRKAISEQLPEALGIVNKLPTADITSLLEFKDEISKTLLTDEEEFKLTLYKNIGEERVLYEERFWKAEDHPIWRGEIKVLLQWSCTGDMLNIHKFDVKYFDEYYRIFTQVFYDECDYSELDITRRVLLTVLPWEKYPKIFRGYTNYSFCWEYDDWKTLINENAAEFKYFFDKLKDKADIPAAENDLINSCISEIKAGKRKLDYDLDKFLIYPEILAYCEQKNVQWDSEKDNWILVPKVKATTFIDLETYVFYLEIVARSTFLKQDLLKMSEQENKIYYQFAINNVNWKIRFYAEYNDGNCCVFSKEDDSCVIDYLLHEKDSCEINLRNGNNQNKTKSDFEKIAGYLRMEYFEKRYRLRNLRRDAVNKILKEIITDLSQ